MVANTIKQINRHSHIVADSEGVHDSYANDTNREGSVVRIAIKIIARRINLAPCCFEITGVNDYFYGVFPYRGNVSK